MPRIFEFVGVNIEIADTGLPAQVRLIDVHWFGRKVVAKCLIGGKRTFAAAGQFKSQLGIVLNCCSHPKSCS